MDNTLQLKLHLSQIKNICLLFFTQGRPFYGFLAEFPGNGFKGLIDFGPAAVLLGLLIEQIELDREFAGLKAGCADADQPNLAMQMVLGQQTGRMVVNGFGRLSRGRDGFAPGNPFKIRVL